MNRSELTAALRAAFLSASGHADGWDKVAEKAQELIDMPRGWANPPKCVVCDQRGTVAEVRCEKHSGGSDYETARTEAIRTLATALKKIGVSNKVLLEILTAPNLDGALDGETTGDDDAR